MNKSLFHKPLPLQVYFYISICLCISNVTMSASSQNDSIFTTYTDGLFSTYYKITVPCSITDAEEVLDDFISQFRGDPELLFEWALHGLGSQKEDKLLIDLKQTLYDAETSIGTIITDLIIPGFTTFKNITIESKITKTYLHNKAVKVFVDVYNLNFFMKKAYGTYYIIPVSSDQVMLAIDVHMKFGWFFNIFITQNIYKSIFEWRIHGFMHNMKKEIIRRKT